MSYARLISRGPNVGPSFSAVKRGKTLVSRSTACNEWLGVANPSRRDAASLSTGERSIAVELDGREALTSGSILPVEAGNDREGAGDGDPPGC